MLTHDQIWAAIDALVARQGLSASGLARLAGLDATTFNKSKRISKEGNPRWPSTESIAKILAATQVGVDEFLSLIPNQSPAATETLPFRTNGDGAQARFGANLAPEGPGWEQIEQPITPATRCFAVGIDPKVAGPGYPPGTILILSAEVEARSGDRVALIHGDDRLEIVRLGQMTATQIHFESLDGQSLAPRKRSEIKGIARILWASQ